MILRTQTTAPCKERRGITLLEVLVALMILLFSSTAIYQLISLASDRAVDVKLHARASMLCQSKLEELKFGGEALNSVQPTPFKNGDSAWQYEIDVADAQVDGLKKVRVTVKQDRGERGSFEVSLSQLILDPAQRGTTFDKLGSPSTSNMSGGGTTP